jgi:hypothetical protein
MPRRAILVTVSLGLVLALSSRPAGADTITITGGRLQMGSFVGTLDLVGERGFTLAATVGVVGGVFAPQQQCFTGCVPGTTVPLTAVWTGSDVRATVTLDGQTYTNVGLITSPHAASVRFSGSFVAPPFADDIATVIAPFLFEGAFSYAPVGVFPVFREELLGLGTAAVNLRRAQFDPNRWLYTSAVYEFEAIPEPATLLLTAAGVVGLVSRRLRRAH